MSSKQNKGRKARRGGKGTPKPKPSGPSRPRYGATQPQSGLIAVPSRINAYGMLPQVGIREERTIKTPHGAGMRVTGCMQVANIAKEIVGTMTYNAFESKLVGTSSYFISLNPLGISYTTSNAGRILFLASAYMRFRFTRMRLHYTPSVGAGVNNSFCMTYFEDPCVAAGSSLPNSGSYAAYADSDGLVMVNTVWAAAQLDITPKLSKDWFFIDVDGDTDAGWRQSYQGVIGAAWQSLETSGAGVMGSIWAEYELELAQPYIYQNKALLTASDFKGTDRKPVRLSGERKFESRSDPPPLTSLSRAALTHAIASGDDSLVSLTRTDGSSATIDLQHIGQGETYDSIDAARDAFVRNAKRCAHELVATRCRSTGELVALECVPCQRQHIWAGSPALRSDPGQKK